MQGHAAAVAAASVRATRFPDAVFEHGATAAGLLVRVPDRAKARPVLVPLLSLGRRVVASPHANGGGELKIEAAAAAGGPELRRLTLTEELFAADAMEQVEKDLMDMKVTELKEELAARGETTTGNRPELRRRLHAAIVRKHLAEDGVDT